MSKRSICIGCNGKGWVIQEYTERQWGGNLVQKSRQVTCPTCGGSGTAP